MATIANGESGLSVRNKLNTDMALMDARTTAGYNVLTVPDPGAITFLRFNADNSVSTRTASQMRGDLGSTTIGDSLFTLANPSAIRFFRANADNSVSMRTATEMCTDIGADFGRGTDKYATTSGTNTYTATLTPTLGAYVAGQSFRFLFGNANTGASTLNIDSLGALTLKKANGQALQSGDIVATTIYTVTLIDTSNAQIDVAAGQQGTWSPAFTGFSVDPSGITARYNTYDNLCWVHFFPGTPGTSNGTGFTVTLPFAAANTAIQYWPIIVINNGAVQLGRLATTANSNIATLSSAVSGTGWTASGNKSAFFTLVYEMAV